MFELIVGLLVLGLLIGYFFGIPYGVQCYVETLTKEEQQGKLQKFLYQWFSGDSYGFYLGTWFISHLCLIAVFLVGVVAFFIGTSLLH